MASASSPAIARAAVKEGNGVTRDSVRHDDGRELASARNDRIDRATRALMRMTARRVLLDRITYREAMKFFAAYLVDESLQMSKEEKGKGRELASARKNGTKASAARMLGLHRESITRMHERSKSLVDAG